MAHMDEYFMISTGINPKVKTAQKSRNHLALCKIFWLENTTQTTSTYTSFKRRHYHISTIIKNATIQECFFFGMLNFQLNMFLKCTYLSEHFITYYVNKMILNGQLNMKEVR